MKHEPIRLNELRLPPGHSADELLALIAARAGKSPADVREAGYRIVRQSVDARRKSALMLQYNIEIGSADLDLQGLAGLGYQVSPVMCFSRPVVVGSGPAGLFAALALAKSGCRPIVIEQGRMVEERQADVARFWQSGCLDPLSNVQFGEGGAGTFSDGKLTTGIKDPRCRAVLEEMVLAGAPQEILIQQKPHVGTDHLRTVVRGLREKIIELGGEFRFNCRLTGLQHKDGLLTGIQFEQRLPENHLLSGEMPVSHLVLAIGHSARTTFNWLCRHPILIEPKPFSIGVRIEHLQSEINRCQYGELAGHPQLPPADYKLACHLPSGRSVYTFCMCPGGQVVAAASETGGVVTNGMSHFAREDKNANSALLVGVNPADFPTPGPLGGMLWQQQIEQLAFAAGGRNYRAPAQRIGDFLRTQTGKSSTEHKNLLQPSYQPGVNWTDLDRCLPPMITEALREALPVINRRMPGFAAPEAILTGPETRSSSPLRLVRDTTLQSAISGLYPCGEGAGYAGGIMSAAVDGLRCAEAVMPKIY